MASTIALKKKRITIGVVALLTLAGAGAAFAYWSSLGNGAGEATTGTSVAFTITSEDAVGSISPGNAGQTVDFTVTNPSDGVLNLTSVTVALANADGTAWVPAVGCSIDDYTATISTAPAYGQIAAGAFVEGTATVTLTNTGANQDACQGQTVPLYFTAA